MDSPSNQKKSDDDETKGSADAVNESVDNGEQEQVEEYEDENAILDAIEKHYATHGKPVQASESSQEAKPGYDAQHAKPSQDTPGGTCSASTDPNKDAKARAQPNANDNALRAQAAAVAVANGVDDSEVAMVPRETPIMDGPYMYKPDNGAQEGFAPVPVPLRTGTPSSVLRPRTTSLKAKERLSITMEPVPLDVTISVGTAADASIPGAYAMAPSMELGTSDDDISVADILNELQSTNATASGGLAGPEEATNATADGNEGPTPPDAPTNIAEPPSIHTRTGSTGRLSSTSSTADSIDEDDVVAIMVEEGTQPNLQQAQPVSRKQAKARTQSTRKFSRAVTSLVLVALVIAIGVILLAALLSNRDDGSTNQGSSNVTMAAGEAEPQDVPFDSSNPSSMTPSSAPSSFLESHVLDALLEDAPSLDQNQQEASSSQLLLLTNLQNSSSPQALAFDWILQDPSAIEYPSSRTRQRFALASLYFATNGHSWKFNTDWLSYDLHECDWWSEPDFAFSVPNFPALTYSSGSPCDDDDDDDDRVYKHIWLWDNNLQGTLPEQVYWLSELRSISVFRNPLLTGTLSTSIGTLRQLEGITAAAAGFTGTLPTEIGLLSDKLTYFSVFGNDMNGPVPSELGQLSELEIIILDQNRFTGTLPSVSNWDKMTLLYAQNNFLSGSLPTEIGMMQSLQRVHLKQNQLSGTIPSEIGQLESLLDLAVNANALTGTLSSHPWPRSLQVLELAGNMISGEIPSEIGAIVNLTHLLLQDNLLTGIPNEILDLVDAAAQEESPANVSYFKAFNVTGNPALEGGDGNDATSSSVCWTRSSFFESPDCRKQHPPASCRCDCSC